MNRHMVYFELLDTIKDNCCPICELIKKRTIQAMDGFLYENVNDTGLRREINSAKGFCSYHSNMLLSMGDPLSHAIVYTDLIKAAITDIKRDNFDEYENHTQCPYCRTAQKLTKTYCTVFIDAFREDEFRKRYEEEGMLCMSHLHYIEALCEKKRKIAEYELIRDITLKKYESLLQNLAEIRRKHDYRYTGELWTPQEKSAWKRAVGVISPQKTAEITNKKTK